MQTGGCRGCDFRSKLLKEQFVAKRQASSPDKDNIYETFKLAQVSVKVVQKFRSDAPSSANPLCNL